IYEKYDGIGGSGLESDTIRAVKLLRAGRRRVFHSQTINLSFSDEECYIIRLVFEIEPIGILTLTPQNYSQNERDNSQNYDHFYKSKGFFIIYSFQNLNKLMLKQNVRMVPMIRNGPNGISLFIFNFLFTVIKIITQAAPTQKDTNTAEKPCARPRRAPMPAISFTSPSPNNRPLEKSQMRKKGRGTKIVDSM